MKTKRIKKKRKQGDDTERVLVKKVLKEIRKHQRLIKIITDSDSPGRVFSSGYDFLLTRGGRVIFVEAKRIKRLWNVEKPVWSLLSDFQEQTAQEITSAGTPYYVMIFQVVDEEVFVNIEKIRGAFRSNKNFTSVLVLEGASIARAAGFLMGVFND